MKRKEIMVIIPARGGSKGIPRKNVVLLAGKPLIAWSIEAALAAKCVNRVIVSTDDEQIASVARSYGSEVVTRPKSISGDGASSESALLHVLDHLETNESYMPDWIVFLQATSPYRLNGDIDNAVAYMQHGRYDSVFSGYRQHFSGRWKRFADTTCEAINYDPNNRQMRQAVEEEFIENGSIYIVKNDIFRNEGCRVGGRIGLYEMPIIRSFQIDEVEDIDLLERIMMKEPQQGRRMKRLSGIELLVLDFDGVMTDNKVSVTQSGEESVTCCRADGLGIAELLKHGVRIVVISTEVNQVVQARCRKLGVECYQGVDDKLVLLRKIAKKSEIDAGKIAFMGNDRNDLACMRWVGTAIAVADAYPEILEVADVVTEKRGGQGAVREVCDLMEGVL